LVAYPLAAYFECENEEEEDEDEEDEEEKEEDHFRVDVATAKLSIILVEQILLDETVREEISSLWPRKVYTVRVLSFSLSLSFFL
jgi:hypothetical protein